MFGHSVYLYVAHMVHVYHPPYIHKIRPCMDLAFCFNSIHLDSDTAIEMIMTSGMLRHVQSCDIVEAHCYFVDIGRTDREQLRSRINNNDCRTRETSQI